MYEPLQKKNSSWIPPTAQKKGKSPSKFGHFSSQPKPNQKYSQPQAIGEYSRESADRLAANVMRSLEAKGQQEAEQPTVPPESESRRIFVADIVTQRIPPLTPHTLNPQARIASGVSPENSIQPQCADCTSQQQEQSTADGKEVDRIFLEAGAIHQRQPLHQQKQKQPAQIKARQPHEKGTSWSQSNQNETLHVLNPALRPPGGDPCFDLLEAMVEIAQEMDFRFQDMRRDRHGLYEAKEQGPQAVEELRRRGYGSWEGHKQRYTDTLQPQLNDLYDQWRKDNRCNNDDIDYYEAHGDWDLITEYLRKKAPQKPDRHRFSIPEWARQAGVFLRDGILWIPKVIGLVLIGILVALARSFGIPTQVY
ncbi:hypothetical protein [Coleofasciculus sp. E1-EBD-02]|uniref:hypothetical protein n=1 Tax=Coleofasciculus sp. E1-EBD-02 TaxID=3068481 RepID=UPI003301AF23